MTPTREQIIEWAQWCDLGRVCGPLETLLDHEWEDLHRFAAFIDQAARADEQKRCCRIVTGLCISDNNAQEITDAIRKENK